MTTAVRPRVTTLSGRVSRARVGKTSALRTPIRSATPIAAPKPSSVKRSRIPARIQSTTASIDDHRQGAPQRLQRVGEDVRCGPRIHVDGESSRIPRRGGRFDRSRGRESGRRHRSEARADAARDRPRRRDRRRQRDHALSDLPAADADRLALRRDLRCRLRCRPGRLARAPHAARCRDRDRLFDPGPDPDRDRRDPDPARRHRRQRSRQRHPRLRRGPQPDRPGQRHATGPQPGLRPRRQARGRRQQRGRLARRRRLDPRRHRRRADQLAVRPVHDHRDEHLPGLPRPCLDPGAAQDPQTRGGRCDRQGARADGDCRLQLRRRRARAGDDRRHRRLHRPDDPRRAGAARAGGDHRDPRPDPADRRDDRRLPGRHRDPLQRLPDRHDHLGRLRDRLPAVRELRRPAADPEPRRRSSTRS